MTQYFQYFPTIEFGDKTTEKLTNIIHRIAIRRDVIANISVFTPWVIQDGETPEIVATKYYGSPFYHWIVMLSNQILDPYFDWCLSSEVLNAYLIQEYGSIEHSTQVIHHYEDVYGNVIDQTTYTSLPANERSAISAYDYWVLVNEHKRMIRLIDREYLSQILSEMKNN